jgi:hypothetical protein
MKIHIQLMMKLNLRELWTTSSSHIIFLTRSKVSKKVDQDLLNHLTIDNKNDIRKHHQIYFRP